MPLRSTIGTYSGTYAGQWHDMGKQGEGRTIAQAAKATDTPDTPYEVRSRSVSKLLLRVQPSGLRTYYVQLRRGHRVSIG
ncbi:MAG: hypothetical protein ABI218_16425, partial [Caldimonas sp.]